MCPQPARSFRQGSRARSQRGRIRAVALRELAPRVRGPGDGPGADGAGRIPSGVLRRDGLDDGCGVLGCVDRPLEPEIDVPPADYDHWVATTGEQRGEGFAEEPVAVVLDPVDLDPVLVEVLEPAHVLE